MKQSWVLQIEFLAIIGLLGMIGFLGMTGILGWIGIIRSVVWLGMVGLSFSINSSSPLASGAEKTHKNI